MQRRRPTKLSNYPWVVVRIDCVLCRRRGRYSLARLAARYGPEQTLDGLLREIAHDCPWWNERARKYESRCGARLVDVEHNLPPPDLPPEPVHRRRMPDRESLPNREREPEPPLTVPQPRPMFYDYPHTHITLACDDCDRRETFVVADVMTRDGDMPVDDRVRTLLPRCRRRTHGDGMCRARVVEE